MHHRKHLIFSLALAAACIGLIGTGLLAQQKDSKQNDKTESAKPTADNTANTNTDSKEKTVPPVLNFTMKSLTGKDVPLVGYKGKVVLMVNVASKCGLTKQYKQLQELDDKYKARGLAILGFPANDFGKQEPGTDEQIGEFCEKNYGVKFDMFSKIAVKGDEKAPLYKYLTEVDPIGKAGGDITWNFEKFLIGRNGQVVARFSPRTTPDDPQVVNAIEAELAKAE
jgi:glutathione peroxidase